MYVLPKGFENLNMELICSIFDEFVSVVQENQKYIIGLIDQDGFIVACSNKDFIGKNSSVIPSNKSNTISAIEIHGVTVGSLWVNGEESLKMMSSLLLESLTTRVMYEMNEQKLFKESTKDDQLIKLLIGNQDLERNKILELVEELEINQDIPRIAILAYNEEGYDPSEIVRLKLKEDSNELIYSLFDQKRLILFKDIINCENEEDIQKEIRAYIVSLQNWGLHNSSYYVGTVQNRLVNYKKSYDSCVWLKNNHHCTISEVEFFTDYLTDFLISKIPVDEVRSYFDFYVEQAKGFDLDEFVDISNRLYQNNFNITQTADDLYIHKNTLIYKIKRFESILNIDIRGSFHGKVLLVLISNALREIQEQKQVGEII